MAPTAALLYALTSLAGDVALLGPVTLEDAVLEPADLSAAALRADGQRLAIASDEGAAVQLLERAGPDRWRVVATVPVSDADEGEADLEGLAWRGDALFAVGSHSLVRKRVDDSRRHAKNLQRIATVERQPGRDVLVELAPVGAGAEGPTLAPRRRWSLRALLEGDPVLGAASGVPGKEGGVDVEGLAVWGERVVVGLRGPVLRGGYAVALVLDPEWPERAERRYLPLGGLGIRELVRVEDGFLVLAGPLGDGPGGFELFHWDGADGLPGEDRSGSPVRRLGTVPAPDGAKPEGLALLAEDPDSWELLLVCDGVEGGAPRRLRVSRPGR